METIHVDFTGSVHISERAVAVVAAVTTLQIPAVVSLGGNLAQGVAAKLGRSNPAKGVDVVLDEGAVDMTIRLVVRYGCRIPDVALQVQKAVKDAVETMTGYAVTAVHIVIQDVDFTSENAEAERGQEDDE